MPSAFIVFDGVTSDYSAAILDALQDAAGYTDIYFDTNTNYPITGMILDTIEAEAVTLHGPATLLITDPTLTLRDYSISIQAPIAVQDLTLDAADSYGGWEIRHPTTMERVTTKNATRNWRHEGFVGGICEYIDCESIGGTVGLLAMLVDPGFPVAENIGTVILRNFAMSGYTANDPSNRGGQSIKIAGVDHFEMYDTVVTDQPLSNHTATLIIAENVGDVIIDGGDLHGIDQFPDPGASSAQKTARSVTIRNIDSDDSLLTDLVRLAWWNQVMVDTVYIIDSTIKNVNEIIFYDLTPSPGCTYIYENAELGLKSQTSTRGLQSKVCRTDVEIPTFNRDAGATLLNTTDEGTESLVSEQQSVVDSWNGLYVRGVVGGTGGAVTAAGFNVLVEDWRADLGAEDTSEHRLFDDRWKSKSNTAYGFSGVFRGTIRANATDTAPVQSLTGGEIDTGSFEGVTLTLTAETGCSYAGLANITIINQTRAVDDRMIGTFSFEYDGAVVQTWDEKVAA